MEVGDGIVILQLLVEASRPPFLEQCPAEFLSRLLIIEDEERLRSPPCLLGSAGRNAQREPIEGQRGGHLDQRLDALLTLAGQHVHELAEGDLIGQETQAEPAVAVEHLVLVRIGPGQGILDHGCDARRVHDRVHLMGQRDPRNGLSTPDDRRLPCLRHSLVKALASVCQLGLILEAFLHLLARERMEWVAKTVP